MFPAPPRPRPDRPVRWGTVLLLALLVWPLVACGVRGQDRAEPAPLTDLSPVPGAPRAPAGSPDVSLWFVSGSELEVVRRPAVDRRPQTAVDLLLAGPSPREVVGGLRTALSPQHLLVVSGPDGSGTAAVSVSREFTGIAGGNQLLAVAQVVWTVTQFPEVDQVRFLFEDTPVEVPTDEGLTGRPVDRGDYVAVAPRPDPSSTPSSRPSSTPPTSPGPPGPGGG